MNYVTLFYPKTASLHLQGYMYDHLLKVYLSSADVTLPSVTAVDLFSNNRVVSAACPPFTGYELPSSSVTILDKNNITIDLPALSTVGVVDVILFNNAGYTKLSDRNYLVSYPIGTLQDDVVAYWKLDYNLNDSTNNNNILSFTDTPVFTTGLYGGALSSFAWDRQYAEFSTSLLNLTGRNGAISFWFKMTNGEVDGFIKYLLNQSESGNGGLSLVVFGDGGIGAGWTDQAGTRLPSTDAYPSYNSQGWNHCILTFDASHIYLYVNGVLHVQYGYSSPIASLSGIDYRTIKLGYDGDAWSGSYDMVSIWKRTLNAKDASDLYNGGKGRDLFVK